MYDVEVSKTNRPLDNLLDPSHLERSVEPNNANKKDRWSPYKEYSSINTPGVSGHYSSPS